MFLLRTTQKLLKVSKLKPGHEPIQVDPLHEWYANLCSTTFPGKFIVLYVHGYSKMAVLVKGKSIMKANDLFLERLELLLIRNGFDHAQRNRIVPEGKPTVLKTNSRSVLGYMNDYKLNLVSWLYSYANYQDIQWNKIEDSLTDYVIVEEKTKYHKPVDLMKKLTKDFS